MSRFDSTFASVARPAMGSELGQSVTYDPDGNDEVTLTAIVGHVNADETDESGRRLGYERNVTIGRDPSATGGGFAAPAKSKVIRIDSEDWKIVSIINQSESYTTVRVMRTTSLEESRPAFRTRTGR